MYCILFNVAIMIIIFIIYSYGSKLLLWSFSINIIMIIFIHILLWSYYDNRFFLFLCKYISYVSTVHILIQVYILMHVHILIIHIIMIILYSYFMQVHCLFLCKYIYSYVNILFLMRVYCLYIEKLISYMRN